MAEKETKKSLKDIIKQINKTCKEWDILSSGNFSKNLKKLSLRSLGFDYPFKGGFHHMVEFVAGYSEDGQELVVVGHEGTEFLQVVILHGLESVEGHITYLVDYACGECVALPVFSDFFP